ncbi:MAG TPA: TMEM165/GDT1 family protein [Vicinamibacterales bacterium]|nr:TMEM165/GDT1 family protein [Vicinamibacterales bacterium]
MIEIFLATYGGVFIAEIVGDKLLYTSGVLATRYSWSGVLTGMALAFMAKMAVAVAIGAAIGDLLPKWLVATLTAVSFAGVAIAMWRKPDVRLPKEKDERILKGASVAFATIFLSEWADKGMLSAGAWAATSVTSAEVNHTMSTTQAALIVWAAAVLAMVTKGGLAVTLGHGIRNWIATRVSPRYVRYGAVAAIVLLGILCVLEILGIMVD